MYVNYGSHKTMIKFKHSKKLNELLRCSQHKKPNKIIFLNSLPATTATQRFFFLLNNWIWQEHKTSYMTQITEVIFGKHTTNQTETQINQPQIRWMLMFRVRKEQKRWKYNFTNEHNSHLHLTKTESVKVVAWSGKPSWVKKKKR